MLTPWLPSTLVVAAAWAVLSWSTFAASVPLTPGATLVMVLPPLLSPEAVKLTGCPFVPLLMVTPALLTRVLPAVRLPSVPRFTSLASLMPMLPSVLATVWMLFSVEIVAPPLRVSTSLGLRLIMTLLLSPVYCCSVLVMAL